MTEHRPETARVLTLTHPYGPLIALGEKHIETRSWTTKYRGPLVIHCSANWKTGDVDLAWSFIRHSKVAALAESPYGVFDAKTWKPINLGKALGWCELLDIQRTEDLTAIISYKEKRYGDYSPDRYGWLLGPFVPFPEPIYPEAGGFHLGLWRWYNPLPELPATPPLPGAHDAPDDARVG